MLVLAPGRLAQRRPRLDRDMAVGLGRQGQHDLGGVDIGLDPGQTLRDSLLAHLAVQLFEELDLFLGVPADALAAVADFGHQRTERGELLVGVGIVALDHHHVRHGLAWNRRAFALFPVFHIGRLRQLRRRVVQGRHQDEVALHTELAFGDFGEFLRDPLENLPVAAGFPHRVDSGGQRVNEGVHVRSVKIVLLVPGCRRQHDVGVEAGGRHAEIERDQEVELAFRRNVVPGNLDRFLPTGFAQLLALHAVLGAQQVLQEIFVTLAARTQEIRAPDKQIARPVPGIVGILAGQAQSAGLERFDRRLDRIFVAGGPGYLKRIFLELRGRG